MRNDKLRRLDKRLGLTACSLVGVAVLLFIHGIPFIYSCIPAFIALILAFIGLGVEWAADIIKGEEK